MDADHRRELPAIATILVIDDLPAEPHIPGDVCDQGHRLLEAADGREGMAVVLAELPDLGDRRTCSCQ